MARDLPRLPRMNRLPSRPLNLPVDGALHEAPTGAASAPATRSTRGATARPTPADARRAAVRPPEAPPWPLSARSAPARASAGAPRESRAPLVAAAVGGMVAMLAAALAGNDHRSVRSADRRLGRLLLGRPHDRVPQSAWWSFGHHTRRHALGEALAGLTGQTPTLAAGAGAALAVARRFGPGPALPVLAAVPLGLGGHVAVKYAMRRPRPLTARLTGKHTPTFPSGHAARGAAMAGMLGYVGVREGVLPAAVAIPVGAAVALVGAGSRVWTGRHWATDVVGGWGLGVTAAALCALWYDAARAAAPSAARPRVAR